MLKIKLRRTLSGNVDRATFENATTSLFSRLSPYITRFSFDPRHDKSSRSSDDQRCCRQRNWLFEPLVFKPGHVVARVKKGWSIAWNSITRSASHRDDGVRVVSISASRWRRSFDQNSHLVDGLGPTRLRYAEHSRYTLSSWRS